MQKKYVLFEDVLEIFAKARLLDELILVGSWCMLFYKDYFSPADFSPSIRTRDIDFLVPQPNRISKNIDIAELLKNEGFIITFNNSGYMRLEHPELIIEFLVPEIGRGTNKPVKLKELGINAQALRFLDLLSENVIEIKYNDKWLKVPHPAAYCLQKIIVAHRRSDKAKSDKDIRESMKVLDAIIQCGKTAEIFKIYNKMPKKWKMKIIKVLQELNRDDICKLY